MDIKPILSVCLSFAEMMGAMLEKGRRLDYRLPIPSNTVDKDSPADDGFFSFQRVGDDIKAINNMTVPVQLTFPSTQYCVGKTITLSPHTNAIITSEVISHAETNSTRFEITVGGGIKELSSLSNANDDDEIVFQASGEVFKEIKGAVSLCDEICVDMIDKDLYIYACSPYNLKGISLLEITFNDGKPKKKLMNLDATAFPVPPSVINKSALYLQDILPDSCSDINVTLSACCSLQNNRNSF